MASGKGISADISGKTLLCGDEKYPAENGVSISEAVLTVLERLRAQGTASVLVAEQGSCIRVIALSDVLRPEAKEMISRLAAIHTRTVQLTGDNWKAADYFARQAGITEVRVEPDEKVRNVEALGKRAGESA